MARTLSQLLSDVNAYVALDSTVPTGTDVTTWSNYANQAVQRGASYTKWYFAKFCYVQSKYYSECVIILHMDTLDTITNTATKDKDQENAQDYYTQYLQALKEEVSNPIYTGLSAQQIADMINLPQDGADARILSLIVGIPYAPNMVLASDIQAAQNS